MRKNTIDDYRLRVNAQYHMAKNEGGCEVYLLNPSTGRLKKFCLALFDDGLKEADLQIFYRYFKAVDKNELRKKIIGFNTDEFRPLRSFFLNKTIPADDDDINLAAILVSFEPRPYLNFRERFKHVTDELTGTDELTDDDIIVDGEIHLPEESMVSDTEVASAIEDVIINDVQNHPEAEPEVIDSDFFPEEETINEEMTVIGQPEAPVVPINMYWKKKALMAFVFLICVGSVGFGVKTTFFPTYNCMEWSTELHQYIAVDCDSLNDESATIVPRDERVLNTFRQINVTQKNSRFFDDNGNATIYYCKIAKNKHDYFNSIGLGHHPITKRHLRPITKNIIRDYVPNE